MLLILGTNDRVCTLKIFIPQLQGERATGYGVALLSVLFGAQTRSRLLKALCPEH